jgi:hypothetical protein
LDSAAEHLPADEVPISGFVHRIDSGSMGARDLPAAPSAAADGHRRDLGPAARIRASLCRRTASTYVE